MTSATIDIVVPIWNRPNETRNCLVNLISYTPGARIVMVDSGSDRETERILQELADSLEENALLLHDDHNIGFVRSANRGLAHCEAPYLALVRSGSLVPPGWFEPLLAFAEAHPDAGILVPSLSNQRAELPREPLEMESGSFCAMVITREAYLACQGFDEGMDDGSWCLKDYTRRACAAGFFTYAVPSPQVLCEEEVRLGSQKRRDEALQRSISLFTERWGTGRSYCVHLPDGTDATLLRHKLEVLLKGARHGDRYWVLLPKALYHGAKGGGLFLHENIRLVPLPRFCTIARQGRVYREIVAACPGIVSVAAVDGIPFPWGDPYLPFTELAERIRAGYPET
ncbi:glycosyltransferase [Geomonas sp. RF6]|uniref:glycosyltransferase family 2 protein n=1 Tax=Geomonas sp. RF6 TaxID=2897342 RepID=UPI001E58446A|nr:glycosyltransferase [Geomonas sp. RF6]UFS71224.1 glycosyltransferase [Geomonas sp. RF6]